MVVDQMFSFLRIGRASSRSHLPLGASIISGYLETEGRIDCCPGSIPNEVCYTQKHIESLCGFGTHTLNPAGATELVYSAEIVFVWRNLHRYLCVMKAITNKQYHMLDTTR